MPDLKLKDTVIHYVKQGSGQPILFIQGVGAAGSAWMPQTQELSQSFCVAAYDNRGLGRSAECSGPITLETMADDARKLMDHFEWPMAHIVGHSMGGLIAQQLAVTCPERVKSLSLLCTFSRGAEAVRMTPAIIWMGLQTRLGTRRMRRLAMLRMIGSRALLAQPDLDGIADQYSTYMGRDLADSPAIIMKQMRAMSRHNIFDRLSRLKNIPTLVVSASEDPIARPEYGRRLADAIPGAKYFEIPEASHAVTIEQSEKVNKLLSTFILSAGRA